MGKQYPSRERFLALPLGTKLGIYREVLAFHSHVAKRGYVSVDFYDGCVLFEEATGRTPPLRRGRLPQAALLQPRGPDVGLHPVYGAGGV